MKSTHTAKQSPTTYVISDRNKNEIVWKFPMRSINQKGQDADYYTVTSRKSERISYAAYVSGSNQIWWVCV